jgi:hypothetical protein
MNNITGPPVEGADFFGRESEIKYAWGRITKKNNLIFPSPRRVGKTSFALKLLDIAKNDGWNIVSINLEKISSEQDFIQAFVDELKMLSWWNKLKDRGDSLLSAIKQIKPSVSIGGAKVELEWQNNKINIYKELSNLLDHKEKTLIFFDELTVLLTAIIKGSDDGKKNVTHFLHWLRDIRIKGSSEIRWIYCSSVGIENFTHQHGISDTMNDMHDYELKSYSKVDSIKMLESLGDSNDLALENNISQAIVDKLGYCLPFFLQIIFEKIHYLVSIEDITLDEAIVNKAYDLLIEEKHFNTWIERLDEQYAENKSHARGLLKHICQANSGVSRENLINTLVAAQLTAEDAEEAVRLLLYMLKNDGYIMEENGLYKFRSPLLRDFWFNRFVK